MGSYLGVAIASANPPKFIHLCYKPPTGDVKIKLSIVGKGLTFDSGGYNTKTGPGCSIELMKFVMGGSIAVLGAEKAIGQIKPPGWRSISLLLHVRTWLVALVCGLVT
jgi:leucyl aminopeptidase